MTNSPVLDDPRRVEREVLNLIDAYNKVNSTEYPQYYAIFNPAEVAVTIVKYNFVRISCEDVLLEKYKWECLIIV